LDRTLENVRNYLRLPPQSLAAYKTRARPDLKQVDFAMLVEHAKLSEKERLRWLAEPIDPMLRE